MRPYLLVIMGLLLISAGIAGARYFPIKEVPVITNNTEQFTETEAGFEDSVDTANHPDESLGDASEATSSTSSYQNIPEPISAITQFFSGRSRWASYWREFSESEKKYYESFKRSAGPAYVGIQVGHWKNSEVPEELSGLKRSGGGAQGGGKTEVETVLIIAQKVKALLEAKGVVVDLLPATVPADYFADAFVSIHADGNSNTSVSGFKIASPQRDFSGKSVSLVSNIYDSYEEATGLIRDNNVTRRMSGYYAFNWRRYEHALSPLTPAAIVETGFMTSPTDRKVIVSNPDKSAKGIADGILKFLSDSGLL